MEIKIVEVPPCRSHYDNPSPLGHINTSCDQISKSFVQVRSVILSNPLLVHLENNKVGCFPDLIPHTAIRRSNSGSRRGKPCLNLAHHWCEPYQMQINPVKYTFVFHRVNPVK